jgi:hypothetical protein
MFRRMDTNRSPSRGTRRPLLWSAGRRWFLLALIVFITLMFPFWPYSESWGYYPVATLIFLLLLFVGLMITGALLAANDD